MQTLHAILGLVDEFQKWDRSGLNESIYIAAAQNYFVQKLIFLKVDFEPQIQYL